jgi:hypothetical protein
LRSARTSSLREYTSRSVLSGAQTTKVCFVGTFEPAPALPVDAIFLKNWVGRGGCGFEEEIAIKAHCVSRRYDFGSQGAAAETWPTIAVTCVALISGSRGCSFYARSGEVIAAAAIDRYLWYGSAKPGHLVLASEE